MAYGSQSAQRIYYALPWRLQEAVTAMAGFRHRRESRGVFFESWFRHLRDVQFVSLEEQRAIAWVRLKNILEYSYRESPFYRRRFEQKGMHPDDIRCPEDLALLPVLTKEEVRENDLEMQTRAFSKESGARSIHTSGTTGKALSILISPECYQREYAYRALHYSWAGASLGQRCAVFAGHPVVHVDHRSPPFWRHDWAENRLLFSSQHLFPKFASAYAEALADFQPEVVHGYPSVVSWAASAIMEHRPGGVKPKAVFTASETLLAHQRALIESAFGCKVYNWYGTGEHLACITECSAAGMHAQMEHSWLEFLDENGDAARSGTPARLVATTLCNRAMPLIRYVVGDIVVPSDEMCACGRGARLVESLQGRIEDYVVGAEGQLFGRLDHIFKDSKAVAEAQILQEQPGAIAIRLVRRPEYTERDTDQLLAAARFRLGKEFRISFDFVEKIPRTRNGKIEFIRSSCREATTAASRSAVPVLEGRGRSL